MLQTDDMYAGNQKSPMDYILESQPIKVHGSVVASYGSESPYLKYASRADILVRTKIF